MAGSRTGIALAAAWSMWPPPASIGEALLSHVAGRQIRKRLQVGLTFGLSQTARVLDEILLDFEDRIVGRSANWTRQVVAVKAGTNLFIYGTGVYAEIGGQVDQTPTYCRNSCSAIQIDSFSSPFPPYCTSLCIGMSTEAEHGQKAGNCRTDSALRFRACGMQVLYDDPSAVAGLLWTDRWTLLQFCSWVRCSTPSNSAPPLSWR